MIIENFEHNMAAHCESGTLTALLNHAGLNISEPMVFGLGSGLYFGYLSKSPNLNFPMFIVRTRPGGLRKQLNKRIHVRFHKKKYRNPEKAFHELDALLEQKIPVAVQVDFYYMDYIPAWERVHANIHHVTVVGKEGDEYIISDSYYPQLARLHKNQLMKGRFARGFMAPKGFMYYVKEVENHIDYEAQIPKSLKRVINNMIGVNPGFIGVKGMRKFAEKLIEWPDITRDVEHLSHEVMKINVFLEDQGTGGAGFRFLFATYLKEAADKTGRQELNDFATKMMEIGDKWREISLFAAQIGKNRDLGQDRLKELSDMIMKMADLETAFYKNLKQVVN